MEEYKKIIRDFLQKSKNINNFSDDDDLFKGGYVDSLFSLQLIVFLEKTFKFKFNNKDIKEDNFRSINVIANTIEKNIKK